MRPFAVTALILVVAVIGLLSSIWVSKENGPDIANPQKFFGCYGSKDNKIKINNSTLASIDEKNRTKIKRFLILKSDETINTVNDLSLSAGGDDLRVGTATTGFFYKFDKSSKPPALLIPDDHGNERPLSRVPC